MTPDEFKRIGDGAVENIGVPLDRKLKKARAELDLLEQAEKKYRRFEKWYRCLACGESWSSSAMFVRSYRTDADHTSHLVAVELVIVTDVLVPQVLTVWSPVRGRPGAQRSRQVMHDGPALAARMIKSHDAENVTLGTFADVLCEPCRLCGQPSLVAALDDFIDDNNSSVFIVGRFCPRCVQVDDFCVYAEDDPSDPQYRRTNGIYRRRP